MSDRTNKYKATSMNVVKGADAVSKQMTNTGNKERAGKHAIDEGDNIFRVYPSHIPEVQPNLDDPYEAMFASYAVPVCLVYLPGWVKEYGDDKKPKKDAKGEDILKKGNKPVFNSRIHGNTQKDLVEETLKMCRAWAEENIKDKDEKQRYLNKVYGLYHDNPALRLPGIKYQTTYAMYADKILGETKKFDRLEVKPTVKDRLNQIAASETSEEPMGTDPFTDPLEGLPIKINYDKARKTTAYQTDLYKKTEKKNIPGHGMIDVVKKFPLTDKELENFEKFPPLVSIYKNVFRRRDFELQVEGLQMFDEEWKLGFSEWPAWSDLVEEIDAYYPSAEEEAERDAANATHEDDPNNDAGTETEELVEDEKPNDGLDLLTRKELVAYIASNKLGIVVKPIDKEDKIRERIRETIAAKALAAENDTKTLPGETGHDEQVKKEDDKKSTDTANKTRSRLDEIRARNKK